MKKIITIMLVIAMCLFVLTPYTCSSKLNIKSYQAFGATEANLGQSIVITLQPNNPVMTVNGVSQEIDPGRKTKPVIVKEWSRTVVPIRAIIEALGGTISWNGTERKVTINLNDIMIELWIDNPRARVNGNTVYIDTNNHDVKPIIVNSRTMLPLRFVAENLGCDVQYNNKTREITLTYVQEFDTSPKVQKPDAPILISPASSSTLSNANATFEWSAIENIDFYKLQIIKDGLPVRFADNITTNSYSLSGITLADGTYSWQVAAHNSAGWSEWSTPFVFIISAKMTVTDIAKFVNRVVFIQVNGYEDGKAFTASGSGFIISNNGEIATNYHVIDGAVSGTVTLNDGTKYNIVSVLGYGKDEPIGNSNDLAVIKINASNLPVCKLGNSNKVEVGESVVTIGSPLGIQNSVSDGIVSKIWNNGLIQITAPISHGSSGGPLFNMYGEVIGVNTYIATNGENINVAIPVNWLKTLDTSLNMTLQQVYEKEHGAIPSLPAAPSLISPADNAVLTTFTPTFSWTSIQGADYYEVWIGIGNIADDKYKIWSQNIVGTSITIPAGILALSQQYTWDVCAHNSTGFGSWSNAHHFTTANTTSSWILTEYEIQDAINWGKSTKDDFTKFLEPFDFGPATGLQTSGIVETPYQWVAYTARKNALEGKDTTNDDVQNILSLFGDKLGFMVLVYGDSIDFAKNYSAKIIVNGKTLYPIVTNNADIASITPSYPNSPAYGATNSYYFNNADIPRDAVIMLVINNGYGKIESFLIDLSKIP